VGKLGGKVAVVTGAGSGIGRAIAVLFAQEGAQVCSASRTMAHAEATAHAIAELGGRALTVQVDVSKRAEVEALAKAVIRTFGRADILCNNAGIGHVGSVLECKEEDWDALMAVNVKGTYLCCASFLPHMLAQGAGNVINIASVVGLVGLPKRAAYSASKGAVIALTRQMAIEYVRDNVRINCICPGTTDSPWVARLLADEADRDAARKRLVDRQPMAFVTGSILVIDGGLTAR
jgi:NAD(P)-dependent dehydrogenase (short-subunit alcohol dehydrogenase family)